MAKILDVIYLETARADLNGIIIYAKLKGKKNAEKIKTELEKEISVLRQFPNIGKVYNNISLSSKYRMLTMKHYLIFYVVNKNTIEIHRIIHNKRNYKVLI